jgi:CHASE3 domain sensor protein
MWPFKQKPASPDHEERIETLERGFRSLKGEWLDHHEQMLRLMGRIAKRAAVAARAAQEAAEVDSGSTNEGQPVLDAFSQQVKALRRHG